MTLNYGKMSLRLRMNQISLKMKYLMMKLTQEYLEGKPPIETANRSRKYTYY
jgi:hypothetical protein